MAPAASRQFQYPCPMRVEERESHLEGLLLPRAVLAGQFSGHLDEFIVGDKVDFAVLGLPETRSFYFVGLKNICSTEAPPPAPVSLTPEARYWSPSTVKEAANAPSAASPNNRRARPYQASLSTGR